MSSTKRFESVAHKIHPMWVNQPSTTQPDHELHGTLVYACEEDGDYCDILFMPDRFPNTSQRIAKLSLSHGWPKHLRPKPISTGSE